MSSRCERCGSELPWEKGEPLVFMDAERWSGGDAFLLVQKRPAEAELVLDQLRPDLSCPSQTISHDTSLALARYDLPKAASR